MQLDCKFERVSLSDSDDDACDISSMQIDSLAQVIEFWSAHPPFPCSHNSCSNHRMEHNARPLSGFVGASWLYHGFLHIIVCRRAGVAHADR